MNPRQTKAICAVCKELYEVYIYLKGRFFFRVLFIASCYTTVLDIATDYLALLEFAIDGQTWWTRICFAALYYSNRLGFYRWARANYRMRDYRMFAQMTEMRLNWTLLVHATPIIGPVVDMFFLHHGGWQSRADSVLGALRLCFETEIVLSCFCWFYIILVFKEIYDLMPTYWEDLKFNPRTHPPAELIVIPALEMFEAVPQITVQFRAYLDPDFDMNDTIFILSVIFSMIGILKATFMFVHYYPKMRLKQGVYKVADELDFSNRQLTEFPAMDGNLGYIRVLYLGNNIRFDAFSIPPMPALKCLRLNDCSIKSLTPPDCVISLTDVSKIAINTNARVSKLNFKQLCYSQRFPLLKSLDLGGNFGFKPDTIPAMPLLNKLSLKNCDLTTLGVKSWSQRFPRLELLEICSNPRLSSLETLNSIRETSGTFLELDKEQTMLPGFQVKNYGAPEVVKEYKIHRKSVAFSEDRLAPFRLKL